MQGSTLMLRTMSDTLEIPIFPLGSVLFPAGRMDLRIFEARYVDMTKACIRDNGVFGVSLIASGSEVGLPAVPSPIGCTARIVEWDVPAAGLFTLTTRGENVFRLIESRTQRDGLIIGTVELLEPPDPTPLPPAHEALADVLKQIMARLGDGHFLTPPRTDDAAWVGYRLAELLPVPAQIKQQLLEIREPITLLDELALLLSERSSGDPESE
jgi:Lon protease-like protein